MPRERILLVEDDKNISRLVKYNLEKAAYDVTAFKTAEDALESLRKEPADLIILDIMLPDMDGFEACRIIKRDENLKGIPIVMLTAKGEEVDRIVGFELGTDDYIVKPFSPRELTLRVKAILKRGKGKDIDGQILTADAIAINIPNHTVSVGGKDIKLTTMEFNLLATLIKRRGRIQTRETLLSDVWGMEADVYTRTVDAHIKRLREKLGRHGRIIETMRGVGYKIKEEE